MVRHTTAPKTIKPKLPIAAPAASTLTASAARLVPLNPLRSLASFSCFSIKVALAGKIAGNAKKRPPITGPNSFAITPAPAVISPPNRNRTAYSYHLVSLREERLIWIFIRPAIVGTRTRCQMPTPAKSALMKSWQSEPWACISSLAN